jgi:hypothetical protein
MPELLGSIQVTPSDEWKYFGETGRRRWRPFICDDGRTSLQSQFECADCKFWISDLTPAWTTVGSGHEAVNVCEPCGRKRGIGPQGVQRVEIDIPPMFVGADLSSLTKALQRALAGWPQKIPQLFLSGIEGRGKTFACWAVVRHLADQGKRATYIDAARIRGMWAEAFLPGQREKIKDRLSTTGLLILDDITRANQSEGWNSVLLDVLNERWQFHRPTLLTSMKTLAETAELYGLPALTSRLARYTTVTLDGPDRRRKEVK